MDCDAATATANTANSLFADLGKDRDFTDALQKYLLAQMSHKSGGAVTKKTGLLSSKRGESLKQNEEVGLVLATLCGATRLGLRTQSGRTDNRFAQSATSLTNTLITSLK
ncbi:hypothetical protein [Ruegeria sp. 6PALISEP08]|uniref:hypothetical protein n=1 Tax=Ruegeria sp. 6PALISEP08 TaxID=1225660 RepID=UPI00067F2D7D|nr:hypothetical protein [Ruegeria sp. 6PALISEP08]